MITDRTGLAKVLWLIALITMIIITGCTRKNNLTGNNWSDARPLIAADSSFTLGYSYTQSAKVKGSEVKLLCGLDNGIEAVALMQFIDLPDSITVVGQPVLKIYAVRRSATRRNPLVLSFYRINKVWRADSTALVTDTDLVPLAITDFTVQDTVSLGGDSLSVNIPNAVIEEIANGAEADSLGFGIAMKVVNPGWLEIKSNEGLNGPLLAFSYTRPDAATPVEYSKRAQKDSHRITGDQDDVTDYVWSMKNLLPQRMYFKFNLPDSIFADSTGAHLSQADIKRMTINKAELVLYVKNNPYFTTASCGFFPYIVTRDSLTAPLVLVDENLELIVNTLSSSTIVSGDSVRIDITAIMQGFTSGDKTNRGIVVKSLQEMLNYGNIEFWHYTNAPAGKKPYVKITYTPPYLKSH
jgi:hypothetical protein